jgi:hypothetical protein
LNRNKTVAVKESITEKFAEYLEDADKITFDIFEFNDVLGRENVLPTLATHCVESLNLFEDMDIDQGSFVSFMKEIYAGYRRDVEYHNDLHGADVMQFSYLMLT